MRYPIAIAVLLTAVGACRSERAMYCASMATDSPNPLFAGKPLCFETANACAAVPRATPCTRVRAEWHCAGTGKDPFDLCMPSRALCEAWTRPEEGGPSWTPCTPTRQVACKTAGGAALSCMSTLAMCQKAEEMVSAMTSSDRRAGCVLR